MQDGPIRSRRYKKRLTQSVRRFFVCFRGAFLAKKNPNGDGAWGAPENATPMGRLQRKVRHAIEESIPVGVHLQSHARSLGQGVHDAGPQAVVSGGQRPGSRQG